MSDTANAATTSTPYANFRARLREVCTIGITSSGVGVSWSKRASAANFNRDLRDPYAVGVVHIETAITEAVGRLAQAVWDDYVEIEKLMELK